MHAGRRSQALGDDLAVEVCLAGEMVVVEVPGRWRQEFTRDQAWELMEALDSVSTAGEEVHEPHSNGSPPDLNDRS